MEEFSGSNDQMIVKGKRTKRPRQSSSASSSGGGGGGGGGGGEFCNSITVSSPATSSGISTCTEEDEDMAKCLILLARGGSPPAENKFRSRKFTEMATSTNGKVGIYVYECKTCNRTFPSFQALGGHRASHKKPKPASDTTDRKTSPPLVAAPEDQEEEEKQLNKVLDSTTNPRPPLNQIPNNSSPHESTPKIHECSICGSEFASGQALGGHMRRHRPAASSTSGTRIGTSIDKDSSSHDVSGKGRSLMSLDLNLPAPPEEDCPEESFHQFSSNQQSQLVFSAAALVDCHY